MLKLIQDASASNYANQPNGLAVQKREAKLMNSILQAA